MPPDADAELWRRLAAADEHAFREIFLRHRDAVYTFAFRRTGSWNTAEDVTQATFTSLWRRAREGRVDRLRRDSARPVLFAMARQECANAVRSRRRQLSLVDRVAAAGSAVAPDEASGWLEAEQTMAAIRSLLDRLPAAQRDVVELVAWAELPMAEAAAVLGVPVGTVKSRLARARGRLVAWGAASLLRAGEEPR